MQRTDTLDAGSTRALAGPITPVRAWSLHLLNFVLPLINFAYLLTGPHSWWLALLWTGPIWALVWVDNRAPLDHRQPAEGRQRWPFDLQLYALTALQIVNHVLLGVMASRVAVWPLPEFGTMLANLFAMMTVSGTTAGYSGIVLAHEWVHRPKAHQFFLGRLLLMFVLYEHFATEHVRGHHARVGTPADPATARFGETLSNFLNRSIPGQFKSAWHLEKLRLGDGHLRWSDPRMLRNRVLQGVAAEVAIFVAYTLLFGWVALIFLVLQARSAVILLETVNYIEHWGITRTGKRVRPQDSWDTDNWFTLHTLVGLSRHADHHAQASRPYHQLRYLEDAPKMPYGYYSTIMLAMFRNEKYRQLASEELEKRRLGPYAIAAQTTG